MTPTVISAHEDRRLVVFDWTLLAAIIVFTALPVGLSFERLLNPPEFGFQRGWGDTLAMLHPVAVVLSPVVAWKRWWWLGTTCVGVAGSTAMSLLWWEDITGALAVAFGYLVLFGVCIGRQAVHTRLVMDPPGIVTFEPIPSASAATGEDAADRIADGILATLGIAVSAVSVLIAYAMVFFALTSLWWFTATLALGCLGTLGIAWSWKRSWFRAGLAMMATPVVWLLINEGELLEGSLLYLAVGLLMAIRYAAVSLRAP